MVRNFRINVDGHVYSVSVEELAADVHDARPGANVTAPPPPHHAGPQPPPAPGSAPVLPAPVIPAPATPSVVVAPSAGVGAGDEVAPLAGVVEAIDVGVGSHVTAGDRIMVIEAMKMKTDVFAKHSGTVTRIAVKIHDGVDAGQPLLTLN